GIARHDMGIAVGQVFAISLATRLIGRQFQCETVLAAAESEANAHAPATAGVFAVLVGGVLRRQKVDLSIRVQAEVIASSKLATDHMHVTITVATGADIQIAASDNAAAYHVTPALDGGTAVLAVAQVGADLDTTQ